MEQNPLRVLVKTDTRTIQSIAKDTGLHPNTITKLIRPNGPCVVDNRLMDSIQRLATFYHLTVKFTLTFEPIEGDNGTS